MKVRTRYLVGLGALLLGGCASLLSLDDLTVENHGSGPTPSNDASTDSAAGGTGGAAGKGGAGGTGGSAGTGGASGTAGTAGKGGAGGSAGAQAGTGGTAGSAGTAGTGGATLTPARPPERPPGTPVMGGGAKVAFAARGLYFGLSNPMTHVEDTAYWKKIGYDVDGKCTTADDSKSTKPGTCTRPSGASGDTLTDGDDCRDNNFLSKFVAFVYNINQTMESDLNATLEKGGPTLVLILDDLGAGPDDPYVPGAIYYLTDESPVDGGTAVTWDGMDVRKFDSNSFMPSTQTPKQSFPKGYVRNNIWVSGDYNQSPAKISLPFSKQTIPLDAASLTFTIPLDAKHEKAQPGQLVAVLPAATFVKDITPAAYVLASCQKLAADIYLKIIPVWSDLSAGAPNFLDPTSECDALSLGLQIDWNRIQVPTKTITTPIPAPPCLLPCGAGLSCTPSATVTGASACVSGVDTVYCCPAGQAVMGATCK